MKSRNFSHSFSSASSTALVIAGLALAATPDLRAVGIEFFTDRSAWEAAAGSTAELLLPFSSNEDTVDAGSSIGLPEGSQLSFNVDMTGYLVPTGWLQGWEDGTQVLAATTANAPSDTQIQGTFSSPAPAFGFEILPNDNLEWKVTVGYSDLTTQVFEMLSGAGRPQFVGWISSDPGQVEWFEITSEPGSLGFGLARLTTAVPDAGSTLLLTGLSLGGLAGVRFARHRTGPAVS
jgi:hypothetical protein